MTGAYLFKKGTYKTSTFVKYVPNECKRRYTVICPPGSNNSSFVHKISRKERKCKSWLPKIKKKPQMNKVFMIYIGLKGM